MNEKDKLILRLQNLKKNNCKNITVDIDYLLNILQIGGTVTDIRRVTPVELFRKVDVDGGGFIDE